MKEINFGKMSYFEPDNYVENIYIEAQNSSNYNNYKFNKGYFNQLLEEERYIDAADYANHYRFNDPSKDNEWLNRISRLKAKGRIAEACNSRITDENDRKAVAFSRHVLDGNIYTLKDNDYVNSYDDLKNQLGGRNARSLKIIFQNKKRKWLGIDWLAKDDKFDQIDKFYQNSGLTTDDLIRSGVRIERNNDGSTSLIFDKNNALSNKILYHANDFFNQNDTHSARMIGLDENKEEIKEYDKNYKYGAANTKYMYYSYDGLILNRMNDLINHTNEITNNYFAPSNEVIQFSSKIGPAISPYLEELNARYENGYINYTEYYKARKELLGDVEEQILGSAAEYLDMRTNAFNNNDDDRHLALTDQEQRIKLHAYLSSIDKKHIHYYSQTSNGKFGTRVVIDAIPYGFKNNDGKAISPNEFKEFVGKEIAIFFPGVGGDIAEKLMMEDTSLRASIELDNMQKYGYDYTTRDKKNISFGGPTGFIINDESVDYQTVVNTINKDMAIDDFVKTVPYKHVNKGNIALNKNGKVLQFDDEAYDKEAKAYAIALAQELHPNVPFTDDNGNIITDIDKIFEIMLTNKYNSLYTAFQYNVYDLYEELYDIWEQIYTGTRFSSYSRINN